MRPNLELPNLRKMFLPDPDHLIFECDLKGADAQVVAWEANDPILKKRFREGYDIHLSNSKDIWPDNPILSRVPDEWFKIPERINEMKSNGILKKFRQKSKIGVHATNYGASPFALMHPLGVNKKEAEDFQFRWFSAHPQIKGNEDSWHARIEDQLLRAKKVMNPFGFHRIYFDRPEEVLPQALAWIPQSTVAITVNKAMKNVDTWLPEVQILLQVHDSFVGQFHKSLYPSILPEIKKCCHIVIPYEDPLIIPFSMSISDKSWGDVEEIDF